MQRSNQKGVALILTLILLLLISVMGVSLMFVSQTETWSSLNYRLMSQARDGAEAGVHSAANYLMFSYVTPSTGSATDPLSNYNTLVTPVQNGAANTSGNDVVLSANSSISSNYPYATAQTNFNTSGVGMGSVTPGNLTVNYNTSAKLLYMQTITPYLTTTPVTIQTWQITSDGTISGVRSATEEVSATLEQQILPVFGYAVFADANGCSALGFGGGGTTNSYNSGTSVVGTTPTFASTDGNVGTNGNLSTGGSTTTINGTLSTPRTGVGTCTSNNITAWTDHTGSVTGGLVQLPQPLVYPNPTIPPDSSTAIATNKACPAGLTGCATSGSGGSSIMTLTASSCPTGVTPPNASCSMALGDVSMDGGVDLHLTAGTYDLNTIKQVGNTKLILDSTPVVINVTGTGGGTVVDLTGGSVTNANTWDASTFVINYAGNGTVKVNGGDHAVGLIYAPNATYSLNGGGDWYGSIIGNTLTDLGGAAVHYDRKLKDKWYMAGPYMLDSFTWNKY
jgi:Tfp pilus assembly protein PilX